MSKTETPSHDPKKGRGLYLASAVVALVCLAIIAFIWYRECTTPTEPYPGETIVRNQAESTRFLDTYAPAVSGDESPIYIPTGVVIQTVEFKGPYTIQMGGYVWQRYADHLPPLDRGVVFPEAESTTFTKVYETQQDGETLIGWNFKTTLREQFNYAKYPLDHQLLWLRMWHVDFEKSVFLEPDVRGYTSIDPSAAPGLDPQLVLENWILGNSYFSYRLVSYNSNFGIDGYTTNAPQPEFYFNIPLTRTLLSPLVARGIAPMLILIQLFVIVLVIGSDSTRLEQFGVRPGAVIFTCAAFFFAVLVAQNALRDDVKWYGIVYLETVHLLTYFVIIAVAANSIALLAFPNIRVFGRDNFWVEVIYWPLILTIVLALTLWVFR